MESLEAVGDVRVEICVEDLEGLRAAQEGGAGRVELCSALGEGGLTASRGLLEVARAATRLPLVALLRPRPGDFAYERGELAAMQRDLEDLRGLGFDGVALGVLTADRRLDRAATAELVARARPLEVVFHRAFDLVVDPEPTLEQLCQLGVERVLTSGQAETALAGADRLARWRARLAEEPGARTTLLAGGGIRPENVRAVLDRSGLREVHASAWEETRAAVDLPALGQAAGGGHARRRTRPERVRALVEAAHGRGPRIRSPRR